MTFNKLLNIDFLELNQDYAKVKMPLEDQFANGIQSLHGGVTATIIDTVSGYLASYENCSVTTNNMNIYYLRPIMVEKNAYVYANANVIKRGKSIIVMDCEVYDESHNLAAKATTSFSVIDDKKSPNEIQEQISSLE